MIELEEISIATEMEFTIQVLVDFGLDGEIRKRFNQQGITQAYFEYMSETDQRELMPKMIDRLVFRKGLAEFKKINEFSLDQPNKSLINHNDNIVILSYLSGYLKLTQIIRFCQVFWRIRLRDRTYWITSSYQNLLRTT